MNISINWLTAYNRLHKFLEGFTGPQFIKAVQQFDPDLLDYSDYISHRNKEGKSTTKKVYFKDILFAYPDNIKRRLFDYFLSPYNESHPQEVKEILIILNGGKVEISEKAFEYTIASTQPHIITESNSQNYQETKASNFKAVNTAQNNLPVVVILTAINEEYIAVREHLSEIEEIQNNGTYYERGLFIYQGNKVASIVIRECGAKNTIAAQETERAIQNFSPDAIFFVGIAGSRKPQDFRVGDVIVPEKIYSYEGGKAEINTFLARPDSVDMSYSLIELSKVERRKSDWKSLIKQELVSDVKVNIGIIASGEKLIEHYDSSIGEILKAHYNDASAIEMEGFGFAKTASRQGTNRSKMMIGVVRGISDVIAQSDSQTNGDIDKRPENSKTLASNTAAAFAFWLITKAFP